MGGRWRSVATAAAAALAVRVAAAGGGAGCNGGGGASSDAGDDSTVEASDICGAFTEAGARCPMVSPVRCFAECEAGGCYCRVGMGGTPTWTCVTDTTCMPDCAPVDPECGAPPGDDGPGEAGDDGAGDAAA